MSFELSCRPTSEAHQQIAEISKAIGLKPTAEKAEHKYGPDGNDSPVVPDVKEGWKYLSSSDGVGVLTTTGKLRWKEIPVVEPYGPIGEYNLHAGKALGDGFPATALLYLRELYWYHWAAKNVMRETSKRRQGVWFQVWV